MSVAGEGEVTHAWLARSVDYGEADRVVTLLTESRGRLSALARGARRSRKRFGGALSLFVEGNARLRRGRGDLFLLESFESVRDLAPPISADLIKVTHGSYVLELARELWPPEQREPELYALLSEALEVIAGSAPSALTLRAYELRLLGILGFAPVVDRCARCNAPAFHEAVSDVTRTREPWAFSVAAGGALCPRCGPTDRRLSAEAQRALSVLVASPLLAAAAEKMNGSLRRDLRDLLHSVLRHHLGKTLKSWDFIAQLAQA
ncbi:MAG: DNA repair protein RecO [Deltaproteobacteria bacterium]|nr:DNA repair protein RecO [Deltaproteobacteria bacterium]